MHTAHARWRVLVWTTAVLLVIAAALTGCSGGTEGDEKAGDKTGDDSTSLLPPAEGKVTYPLTLTTDWGEVRIEERPERVAAADFYDLAILVALGVTPVGVGEREISVNDHVPWAADHIDVTKIGHDFTMTDDWMTVATESVATATPDLIWSVRRRAAPRR